MNNIRKFREIAGVSQKQMAKDLGVCKSHISMIETGSRTPSLELAKKIALYMCKTLDEVFPEENSTTKNAV